MKPESTEAHRRPESAQSVYERIGTFLCDQRLEPNPVNYAFAFHVVTDPGSSLAAAVASLTDGGIRLTQRDIDDLGVEIDRTNSSSLGKGSDDQAERLMAQTQLQVENFADIMATMHVQTRDFGRDLVASADAIQQSREDVGRIPSFLDDIARITTTMVGRIDDAERRLEQARNETEELRRKLEQARGDALRDPLTGLPNRRAFEEAYAAAMREGRAVCVAICDVDHFKNVNDRFGHAVGDRVLRAIAQTLTQSCEGHFVARYGGEEFALLFYGRLTDAVGTIEVARQTVGEKRYRLRETDAPLGSITFSAGVSCAASGEALGDAFQRADQLLYAAKASGRNTVLFDGELSD
ncbi:GGDEF domain-containing protein [Sphingomonas sp.]